MEAILDTYGITLTKDALHDNVKTYFESFGRLDTFEHTLEVVESVKLLKQTYDFDEDKCIIAAYLHDLGKVVENKEQVNFCRTFGHLLLKGEAQVPELLHQVTSKIIAFEIFGVRDEEILNAVGYHTTLKQDPNTTEKILFLAEKISWKDDSHKALVRELELGLQVSIDNGIYKYFQMMHDNREALKCYHKWSQEAYGYFKGKLDDRMI